MSPHDEGYIYGGGYEDWDYNNRLLELGIPVMVTKRSLVWHGETGTRNKLERYHAEGHHNRQLYLQKWGIVDYA